MAALPRLKWMNESKEGEMLGGSYKRGQGTGEGMVGVGLLTRRPLDP